MYETLLYLKKVCIIFDTLYHIQIAGSHHNNLRTFSNINSILIIACGNTLSSDYVGS